MADSKADTEKLILEAARKVFVRKGLDGARMQEIADEAGINKALLHYYFRSKDKLFEMVFSEAMITFFPKVITVMASSEIPFNEKLGLFVDNYLTLLYDNPFLPAFIIGELNKNPDQLTHFMVNSGLDATQLKHIVNNIIPRELGVTPQQARQIVINIISLCVFPLLGRPLIERILFQSDKGEYDLFLKERKQAIVSFIEGMVSASRKE